MDKRKDLINGGKSTVQRLVRKTTIKGLARRGSALAAPEQQKAGGRGSPRLPRALQPGNPAPAPPPGPACLTSESGGAGCLAAGGAG